MSDRGEYRAIHTVLMDGPDFQRLTPEARWVLIACRLSLGPSGIDVVPGLVGALEERTGHDAATIRRSLEELHAGGWIELERNVLWVIEGLRHEPSLNVNNINHRSSVRNHAKGLPHLPIVERFREHYPEWMIERDQRHKNGMGDSIPDGIGTVPASHTPSGKREEGIGKGNREKNPSPSAREEPPPGPASETHDAQRNAMLARFDPDDAEWVNAFIEAVEPPPRRAVWVGVLDAWTQGLDLPPGPPKVTTADIAQGLRDYRAGQQSPTYNVRHVRGHVVAARDNRTDPKPANGRGPPRNGGTLAQRNWANALAAQQMPPLPGDG